MEIIRTSIFNKQLKKIKDKKTKEKLFKQIKKIIQDPEIGSFLSYSKSTRKVYVPPFRLLYRYQDNKLFLLDFDHRKSIYKKKSTRS